MTAVLEVVHDTAYDYAAPVSLAHHLAHLQPLQDEHQQLTNFELTVEPQPAQSNDSVDAMGNAQRHFSLTQPHRQLRVRARSRVSVAARFGGLQPEASPPWETLAAGLRYVALGPYPPAVEWALPSLYVPRLGALREQAQPHFAPGTPVVVAALSLMRALFSEFRYQSDSTKIDTPLQEVLLQRAGVCQDFAHLMIGALRMWGLPARYVSGYLLTRAPEGGAHLLGADASHAWLQVWCPGTPGVPDSGPGAGWLDLDPTNNVVPGTGHVRVAIGRDFGDVTPLRGVIRGGGRHTLRVAVSTRQLEEPVCAAGASDVVTDGTDATSPAQAADPERELLTKF